MVAPVSRRLPDILLATTIVLSGLATIKVYIGAPAHWLLIVGALGAAVAVAHGLKAASVLAEVLRRHAFLLLPWGLLIAAIAAATLANDLTPAQERFAAVTGAKLAALAACLVWAISLRPTPAVLEGGLKALLVIATGGVALALLVPDLAVLFRDGRSGWFGAWPGVLWKAGIFLLPIVVYRWLVGGAPSCLLWIALAASIIALDGSRAGLLIGGGTLACVLFLVHCTSNTPRPAILQRGALAVASVAGAYLVLEPFVSPAFEASYEIRVIRSSPFVSATNGSLPGRG